MSYNGSPNYIRLKQMNQSYNRSNPLMAKMTERTPLCDQSSGKEIYHLVIDIKGSGMTYEVGDCLAILPSNNPDRVKRMLAVLGIQGEEIFEDARNKDTVSAQELFSQRVNINDCPLSIVNKLAESMDIQELLEDKEKIKRLDLVEFLEGLENLTLSAQDVVSALRPMMPRFYSIASSMEVVGEEVHLTVALGQCEIDGKKRLGVCTDYLCRQAPLNQAVIPVYLHPHRGFTLPDNQDSPIIMVGPGTGIAPFRGFMQQREQHSANNKNWLFFGDWHKAEHYYYQDYWESLSTKGMLKLDLAFSRDQEEKVYVQHRMLEKGEELFQWLEQGAYFYVCGNASHMAKDVEAALLEVLKKHGSLSEEDAKGYVKKLRSEKRYLRDVY